MEMWSSCFFDKQTIIKKKSFPVLCLTISLSLVNCLLILSTITTFDKMFPRVCMYVYVCVLQKNWDRIRPFQTKRIFLDCFSSSFFVSFFILSYCFFWLRDSSLPQVHDRVLTKKSSESFQSKLDISSQLWFLITRHVNLWWPSRQAFFVFYFFWLFAVF